MRPSRQSGIRHRPPSPFKWLFVFDMFLTTLVKTHVSHQNFLRRRPAGTFNVRTFSLLTTSSLLGRLLRLFNHCEFTFYLCHGIQSPIILLPRFTSFTFRPSLYPNFAIFIMKASARTVNVVTFKCLNIYEPLWCSLLLAY